MLTLTEARKLIDQLLQSANQRGLAEPLVYIGFPMYSVEAAKYAKERLVEKGYLGYPMVCIFCGGLNCGGHDVVVTNTVENYDTPHRVQKDADENYRSLLGGTSTEPMVPNPQEVDTLERLFKEENP